jgi:uncharacterized protein HemX
MTQDRKQKVLLGVLVALILGAGTTWYVSRDSKTEQVTQTKQKIEKTRRGGSKVADTKKVRAKRKSSVKEEVKAERSKRETKERKQQTKKRRKSNKKKKKKKNVDQRAA